MPVPTLITDLTAVASTNSPQGTETVKGTIDDYFRAQASFIRQIYDATLGPTVILASAATVNIGFAASQNIGITGTTTITAFDTYAEGTLRWVVFAGALTLTHNATTLQLPGSASIVTSAGDAALFKSLGSGNWKCLDYQRINGQGAVNCLPIIGGTMTGPVIYSNNIQFQVKDSGGTGRQLFNMATDNTLNWTVPGGVSWNIYNQAGSLIVWSLSNAGATTQTGSHTISTNGTPTVSGGAAMATSGAFGGGYKMIDGSQQTMTWMASNVINWGFGSGSAFTSRMTLDSSGTATAVNFTATSDERYKMDWRELTDDQLDDLLEIDLVGTFTWIDGEDQSIGASAQQIRAIIPQAVHEDKDGKLSVNYGGLSFAVLLSDMKRRARVSK